MIVWRTCHQMRYIWKSTLSRKNKSGCTDVIRVPSQNYSNNFIKQIGTYSVCHTLEFYEL